MEKTCRNCELSKGVDEYRSGRSMCKKCENKIRYVQNKNRRLLDPEYDKKWKRYDVERKRKKESEDEISMVIQTLRQCVRRSFKRKGYTKRSRTYKILGKEWNDVKEYFESLFKEGMTWDNHGLWEIDHIIPLSTAKSIDDVELLCHYTNLQPLWKKENRDKSNK